MKVFIIESNYPEDLYRQQLDGVAAQDIFVFATSFRT
jgi:hypothetical protein